MRPLHAALLALALVLTGCVGGGADHYERALGIERELLRRNPTIGYEHPGYVNVLRELAKVPRGHDDRPAADTLRQRISDGRRIALTETNDHVDHLPRRLRGADKPAPTTAPLANPAARRSLERQAARDVGELTAAQKEKLDITMYSTSWCGYCRQARRFMTSKGYPFVELDVEKDPAAGRDFARITGGRGGVPVIVVNGTVLRGFDSAAIDRAVSAAL